MNELKEILSALLLLSQQHEAGAPLWVAVCAALALAVAFYGGIARVVMSKWVRDFTMGLLRAGAALLTWLSAQPGLMFAGLERSLWRRLAALSSIVLGLYLGLSLIPAMWIVSNVLVLPSHPRFLWAGPVLIAEFYLLFLCAQLVRAGWTHAR